MKKSYAMVVFVLMMVVGLSAQADFVADGYTKVMTLNSFGGTDTVHYPIVAELSFLFAMQPTVKTTRLYG